MPPAAERESPHVPNHEMVRVIGRGAYGEIWMARSLTGALRAIKIVDRRTFASEGAFQREFEGMARFEPISRSDAGFMDILHVGRDDAGHFFYYVMELADDITGERVDPANYAPKTLGAVLGRRSPLLIDECLSIGLSLTRALGVLHRHGFVHRDIKPANIIFVGGVPKIADIGLVAASGQISFVGTEGYVPPEGPGAVQADLFSLGKVLYEIAMGKDRLDFPALQSHLTSLPDKERLMRLNAVLLRACAPRPEDRYHTAEEMHEDIERARDGKPPARHGRGAIAMTAGAVALATLAGGGWLWESRQPGNITIDTDPPGGMVLLDGIWRHTPAEFDKVPPGRRQAVAMHAGYDSTPIPVEIHAGGRGLPLVVKLLRSRGVLQIESTPPGAEFTLFEGERVAGKGTTPARLAAFPTGAYIARLSMGGREESRAVEVTRDEPASVSVAFASGQIHVGSQPEGANITIDGKPAGVAPLDVNVPEGAHEIVARYKSWPELRKTVMAERTRLESEAFEFLTGSVKITSAPAGASVYVGKTEIGKTPLLLSEQEPGKVAYELRYTGFAPCKLADVIRPGEQTFLGARMIQRNGPQRGKAWENSLGMKFIPVQSVLVSVWTVRIRDYDAYCLASGKIRQPTDFPQGPAHPVVLVNWDDATAFCSWLTEKEVRAGTLEQSQVYRLPTDAEWSEAAGLPPEGGATPEQRDGKIRDFPWGRQWPPPAGAGNYADGSAKRKTLGIAGYHDRYAQTSPVGSFAANKLGLFDMGGNVWQWVLDSYKGAAHGKDWGVLRGGSWATSSMAEMRSSYRYVVDRQERDVIYGFRPVLVPEPEP